MKSKDKQTGFRSETLPDEVSSLHIPMEAEAKSARNVTANELLANGGEAKFVMVNAFADPFPYIDKNDPCWQWEKS
ncbi:MAG: hypothetical protein R3C03_17205 [Pirellulaceae bacterium]